MSLSYLQLNYDTYVSERNEFIKKNENGALAAGDMSMLDAHPDSIANSIAMGYGYDLFQNIDSLKQELSLYVTAKGTNTTVSAALDQIVSWIKNNREGVYDEGKFVRWQFKANTVADRKSLVNMINATITLGSEPKAVALMELKVSQVENKMSIGLGSDDIALSRERIALVDLRYN